MSAQRGAIARACRQKPSALADGVVTQAKYRPAAPEGQAAERPDAKLEALLAAETLDVEALKAALAERPAPPPGHGASHAAMLAEIRAVLTDAQRAAIVAKLEAQPTPPARGTAAADRPAPPTVEERVAKTAERLALTDTQQAALVTFETALDANRAAFVRPEPDHAAQQAAMLTFWKTGETAALDALAPKAVEPPAFPADAFIALAQTLKPEQRTQLLAHPGGPGGHGRRGGPDGFGARGGAGAPGGFGGHGGPGGPGGERGPRM